MNSFGRNFRLTTFGESHGEAMGGIIDGCPSGISIDMTLLDSMLARRRPGTSRHVTPRQESDRPRFLSGISPEGTTLGTPIGFIVENKDRRSGDYDKLINLYRPNHADYTYQCRYGIRDHRGGGRASARETVSWVVGGAIAASWLQTHGIKVRATLAEIGGVAATPEEIERKISVALKEGDSIGGIVECVATGVPAGIGSPVFDKLDATIAAALMGINGVKGVECGAGFRSASMTGSQCADIFYKTPTGEIATHTNNSGGIQGGISNGMPILFRVAFKPTPTIRKELPTIAIDGTPTTLSAGGRHDPCIAIRGTVVAEAVMAMAIADQLLEYKGLQA